jgi:hypothetical protein
MKIENKYRDSYSSISDTYTHQSCTLYTKLYFVHAELYRVQSCTLYNVVLRTMLYTAKLSSLHAVTVHFRKLFNVPTTLH